MDNIDNLRIEIVTYFANMGMFFNLWKLSDDEVIKIYNQLFDI